MLATPSPATVCKSHHEIWCRVNGLKRNLDEAQINIDKYLNNTQLMEQGVTLLKEYTVALEYEEKLLFQKAKVDWLNDGDRNFAFFHKVLKEFFAKGKLLGELNATLITLVPKISTPNKVSDFRPIACYNVTYKCISKIITNRIKNVLDSIVHKNQSAFIPDRQIINNILLTQELLKGYDCKKGPKRCFMKINIQKSYDIVD
nr:RNA-directed DNA polymerase, eukaryota, reverse transcriptase zinc-binding domain protein [Tanacetum cinerariifolium]